MREAELRARDLTEGKVLRPLNLDLVAGERIGIVGPNGAGKSTLLRCLEGGRGTLGDLEYGKHCLKTASAQARARWMGSLPQTTRFSLPFTVAELVGLRSASAESYRQAIRAMELEPLLDRSLLTLSGGEQQRAALGRVLAQGAPVTLLDEPLTHLDLRYQGRLLDILSERARAGSIIVCVFHDLRRARAWCSRILLLNAGELVALGTPEEVLTAENLQRHFGVGPEIWD